MSADGDSHAVQALLVDLTSNIDGIDIALKPLLAQALSTTSSKLPLLDKAKVYVHTAYAIESLVFSYLKLNNVDAKAHPVFKELGRVRAYFKKIEATESAGPQAKLDKAAAARFIKQGLSGNEEYDRKRAEAKVSQEAGAKRKLDDLNERYSKAQRYQSIVRQDMAEDDATGKWRNDQGQETEAKESTGGEQLKEVAEPSSASKKRKRQKHHVASDQPEKKGENLLQTTGEHGHKKKKKGSSAPKSTHEAFKGLIGKGAQK